MSKTDFGARLNKIHAILTDEAIEWIDLNDVVIGYTAKLDMDTFRTLMNLSDVQEVLK